jgi:hypothetical protein
MGPTVMQMFFSFSVVSLVVVATNYPFRRNPNHPAVESQSFRFSVKIFSPSPEKKKKKFTGPEHTLRGTAQQCPVAGYCEQANEHSAAISNSHFLGSVASHTGPSFIVWVSDRANRSLFFLTQYLL